MTIRDMCICKPAGDLAGEEVFEGAGVPAGDRVSVREEVPDILPGLRQRYPKRP
jgi:hypothetical protein